MSFVELFEGSDQFYLADPTNITIKANGGSRWGVKREFSMSLGSAIEGHLDGTNLKDSYGDTGKRGVVLPPIRKSDNKCRWGAIDVDGNIYKDDNFKIEILNKISDLDLPIVPCFSKSKGLHLYVRFSEWTDAQTVIDILHTFLHKLGLPPETECFPKQAELKGNMIGNGIMLPYMKDVGNVLVRYWDSYEKKFITGSRKEFEEMFDVLDVNAEDIKIELPVADTAKANGEIKDEAFYNDDEIADKDKIKDEPTKFEILKKIKDGTIKPHPTIGGTYYGWIQIVICKAIKQGCGDNEILKLIKEVHKDKIGKVDSEYTWPESYKKQINYTRGGRQLNKPNPGDTKILEGISILEGAELEKIFKDYCYVMANDMFNKLGSIDFFQNKQLNNMHKHQVKRGTLTDLLLKSPDFAKAETFVTSSNFPPGLINITKPKMIPLINKGVVLNIYVPNYVTEKKGDVQFLIDFFIWLVGIEKWKIIEQWIAYNLQYPGEKIKWAVVLVSVIEGAGKGLLARILSRILGSDNVNENANYKHLTNTHNTLLIGTQVLVLNEVSLGDFKSKQEGTNTLKNFVADDTYSCNFKNKPMVKLPNLTNIIINSNDERVVGAPQGGRRYFFCNIARSEQEIIEKTDEGFFQKAWDFADSDEGAAALIYYFNKEITITDPAMFKKRAPETEDLKILIEQSKHPLQKKLEHDLKRQDLFNRKIFTDYWSGLITFDWLNEKLNTYDKDETKKFDWGSFGDDAIYKFLSANAIRWNNGEATRQIEINGVRHRFYNLDDTCCPIPGKSYKDLTPKQIETIYLNYRSLWDEIRDEEENYIKAKEKLPTLEQELKKIIKSLVNAKPNKWLSYPKLVGMNPDECFKGVLNYTIDIGNNNKLIYADTINKFRAIVARGVRSPEQILETYRNKYTSEKKQFNL